jgi:hypothetical protein
MRPRHTSGSCLLILAALLLPLAACTPAVDRAATSVDDTGYAPQYQGIRTQLLEGDLVSFKVAMTGARVEADVADYARCAAAQYALIRGFGFARLVRTTVERNGALWSGDAVYTVSASLPPGVRTIDAEVTVRDCQERDIPTV